MSRIKTALNKTLTQHEDEDKRGCRYSAKRARI